MQHQITIAGSNKNELIAGLKAHLAFFGSEGAKDTEKSNVVTQTPASSSRRAKAPEPEETFGEDPQHEEVETASDDADTDQDADSDDTAEPTVSTDDVRNACAKLVKKLISKGQSAEDARAKVRGILKKHFKVTLVDQLDESDLPKALKLVA